MIIFIDESGIHKSIDHATFVLVYVTVKNYDVLEKAVQNIERQLGIEYFHWSEAAWPVKKQFLEAVLLLNFNLKVAVVKNPVDPGEKLEWALRHLIVESNIKKIVIDGKKPQWYERRLKKILRDKGLLLKRLKTARISEYAGSRIADLAAGLCRWYFDNKHHEKIDSYYEQLRKKMIVLLE